MKAYHLRTTTRECRKDYLYVPEKNLFVAHYSGEFSMKMDYSKPYYLQIAHDIINGMHVNPPINPDLVKAFEIDESTALKIERNRTASLNGSFFDKTTEGLVKILSEEKAKSR